MRYCPNSPIALKDRMYSTYLSPILATPKDDVNAVNSPRKYMIEKEKRLGTALPIVECHIHDEFYYAPQETHLDDSIASPFRIVLRVDGSVKAGRVPAPRTFVFSSFLP